VLSRLLLERQALLTSRFERRDDDRRLEFYDSDLSYSEREFKRDDEATLIDLAWHATNLTYTDFEQYLRSTYNTSWSVRMKTHGV
jgi:hypothetical protein